ncbi:hypothetical protein ACFL35_17830 [Candidatus Riflebacteria bacterium]
MKKAKTAERILIVLFIYIWICMFGYFITGKADAFEPFLTGLVIFLIAIYLIKNSRKYFYRSQLKKEIQTTKIADIKTPGYYEIKGNVLCEQPVDLKDKDTKVIYSNMPLVYAHVSVGRLNDYQGTGDDFKEIFDFTKMTPFYLEDDSGRVKVNPKAAEIVPISFEDDYTPGRRAKIEGIRTERPLYVLGYCHLNSSGEMEFSDGARNEINGSKPLLLSTESEEHLIEIAEAKATLYVVFGSLILFFLLFWLLIPVLRTVTSIVFMIFTSILWNITESGYQK